MIIFAYIFLTLLAIALLMFVALLVNLVLCTLVETHEERKYKKLSNKLKVQQLKDDNDLYEFLKE